MFDRRINIVKKNTLNTVYTSILNNYYPFFSKKSNIYFSKLLLVLTVLIKFYLQTSIFSKFLQKNVNQYSELNKDYFSKDLSKIDEKSLLNKGVLKKNFFFNFNNPVCNVNTSLDAYTHTDSDFTFEEYQLKNDSWNLFLLEYKNTYDTNSIKNKNDFN